MPTYIRVIGLAVVFLSAIAGILFLYVTEEMASDGHVTSLSTPPVSPVALSPQADDEMPKVPEKTSSLVTPDGTKDELAYFSAFDELPLHTPAGEGTSAVSGVVVNEAGIALSGMKVYAFVSIFHHTVPSFTDGNGHFLIEYLRPDTYEVGVRAPDDFGPLRRLHGEEVTLKEGESRTGLRLTYNASEESVTGRVTNKRGEPIVAARVYGRTIISLDGNAVETDEDGRYVLYPHAYSVSVEVEHTDYSSQQRHVKIGEHRVDFALEGRGAVEGRVLVAATGEPLTDFDVAYTRGLREAHDFLPGNFETVRDADGYFEFEGVDVGEVTVFARASGFGPARQHIAQVRAGETSRGIVLRVARASGLNGIVKNSRGESIQGATVTLKGVEASITDATGEFAFTGLHAEHTELEVKHSDYAEKSVPVSLTIGAESWLEVRLDDYAVVEGNVFKNGVPLEEFQVSTKTETLRFDRDVRTDTMGVYRIDTVPEGEVTVIAYGPYGKSQSKPITAVAGQTTVVDFEFIYGEGNLVGTVSVDGVPLDRGVVVAKAVVALDDKPEQVQGHIFEEGAYVISGLLGGTYAILVGDLGATEPWLEEVQEVVVEAGQTVALDLTLLRSE